MLPLVEDRPPRNAAELAGSIRAGLAARAGPGGALPEVAGEGADPDRPERIEIRLGGVDLPAAPPPAPEGEREPGPVVASLIVSGRGARLAGRPFDLSLSARAVRFARARAADGTLLLVAEAAAEGEAEVYLPIASLEGWIVDAVRDRVAAQGLAVESAALTLAEEEGAVRARLVVTVRKLFRARVVVSGRLAPADGPALRLSGLACRGEGMAGGLVAKLVRPAVERLEGRSFALAGILPPGLRPGRVDLSVEDGLRIRAGRGAE